MGTSMLDFENNTEHIGQTTQGQVTEVASPAGESSCLVPEQQATVVGHDAGLEDVIETMLGLDIVDELDEHADMQAQARETWKIRAREKGLLESEGEKTPGVDDFSN